MSKYAASMRNLDSVTAPVRPIVKATDPSKQPSALLRHMLNSNENIYKSGVSDGMTAARSTEHLPGQPNARVSRYLSSYKYHLMVCNAYNRGVYGLENVAFSQGFVAGWTAITSGAVA